MKVSAGVSIETHSRTNNSDSSVAGFCLENPSFLSNIMAFGGKDSRSDPGD